MKHLLKKIKTRGAGGGKEAKVTPANLTPHKIGDHEFGSSFSIAETIDLISDGPIEGLVDSEGTLLPPSEITRGVYLNDVAIAVKSDQTPQTNNESTVYRVDITEFQEVYGTPLNSKTKPGSVAISYDRGAFHLDQTVGLGVYPWREDAGQIWRNKNGENDLNGTLIENKWIETNYDVDRYIKGFELINGTEEIITSPQQPLANVKVYPFDSANLPEYTLSYIQTNKATISGSTLINFISIEPPVPSSSNYASY